MIYFIVHPKRERRPRPHAVRPTLRRPRFQIPWRLPRMLKAGLSAGLIVCLWGQPAPAFDPFKAFSPTQKTESVLKVQTLVEPESLKPRDPVRLHLRVTLAAGWHIYSLKATQPESLATSIQLESGGLLGPGKWRESEPRIAHDGALDKVVAIHEDFVEFDWQGRVAENVQPGTHALAGEIVFRACDNRVCTLPRKTAFTAEFTVLPD